MRSYIKYNWFFEWLPYVAVAIFIVLSIAVMLWVSDMRDQDCRNKGGHRRVSTGRYTSLCVTEDGRIAE